MLVYGYWLHRSRRAGTTDQSIYLLGCTLMAGNTGGDEIHSSSGDNSKNIATGKRIEQDNRTTGATYYNYAAPDTQGHLTLEQRMDHQEATMADLIDSLYGNKQRIRDGNRRQQEGDRLDAIENELENLKKGTKALPVSFNTALMVVILIIFFFILLAITATWLQNSGPKTVALSLLQLITQAAPYWRMYLTWTGLIGF